MRRGFCRGCGTPLFFDPIDSDHLLVVLGSLDDPERAPPVVQVNPADKLSFVDGLHELPTQWASDIPGGEVFIASVVSHQHPDHDTEQWPRADD